MSASPSPLTEDDVAARQTVVVGFFLLAVFLPLGLTLEALHALKVDVYLQSAMRREMWTLAHAHGGVLGILCLAFGAVAPRYQPGPGLRGTARVLRWGAILMPTGFLLAGIGNHEGDPSLGILLVPLGGVMLLIALMRSGLACRNLPS